MSANSGDRLYNLLPALYRVRDSSPGEPLRALLAILESELDVIDADIAGLYENWFIETCQEWVVPYIGDLLGTRGLKPMAGGTFTARPYVAHTLRYRRQKGTAAMLEQLARDVTNWPARVVEFFQFLDTTQHLNHLRLQNVITPDLRDTNGLELLGGPFEQTNHILEMRSAANKSGKYNVPNLGIYLWRLESYPLIHTTARPATTGTDGRYRFDALGFDAPLFNQPPPRPDGARVTDENQVPGALRRRTLYDDLEALRQAIVDGEPVKSAYFDASHPVVVISKAGTPVPPEQIVICDLSDQPSPPGSWRPPPASAQYTRSSDGAKITLPIAVSIDPLLGRLAFAAGSIPPEAASVLVSYSYGFSGNIGGGPYDRSDSLPKPETGQSLWQVAVTKELTADNSVIFPTLTDAVENPTAGWNAQPPRTFGTIVMLDSRTYTESPAITIPEGSQLLILGADWPGLRKGNAKQLALEAVGVRPHLLGTLQVTGLAAAASLTPGALILNGLLLEGILVVEPGNLGSLHLVHCTLAPGTSSLQVTNNPALEVALNRSICAPLSLGAAARLNVVDSIVDAAGGTAIMATVADASIQTSTVFGAVGSDSASGVRTLQAGNGIFVGPVFVERRQTGCVRFCGVAKDSRTPRRYRCQPDLALKDVDDSRVQAAIRARLTPLFNSVTYGQPGYAQLSPACAPEIRTGAEDGSEMGAFSFIRQPQREDNLRTSLEEYLRFGLEAGIFFVT
jgi:hypothetical protein